jgi:hypothetical protein
VLIPQSVACHGTVKGMRFTRKWFVLIRLRPMPTRRASRPLDAGTPAGIQDSARNSWVPWAVGAVSLVALLLACRGAPLGVPAADDYDYLHSLD